VNHEELRSIHLNAFEFRCDEPLKMLDVNAKLSGWIDDEFGTYDHDANLKVFRDFCDMWGIDISKEDSEALIAFFEGYACAGDLP
jgi:hypothetical protein